MRNVSAKVNACVCLILSNKLAVVEWIDVEQIVKDIETCCDKEENKTCGHVKW